MQKSNAQIRAHKRRPIAFTSRSSLTFTHFLMTKHFVETFCLKNVASNGKGNILERLTSMFWILN